MPIPLQVAFHDLERSDAIEDAVRKHAEELEQLSDRITNCRVVVGAPHRSQTHGRIYSVRIDVSVPRKEIIVNKEHGDDQSHEDVYVAINHAFKSASRQLRVYTRKLRGDPNQQRGEPHDMP